MQTKYVNKHCKQTTKTTNVNEKVNNVEKQYKRSLKTITVNVITYTNNVNKQWKLTTCTIQIKK